MQIDCINTRHRLCAGPHDLGYPNAPAAFDRAGSDPKALEIADKVFAAASGNA